MRDGEQQRSALPLTLRGRYTAPLYAQLGRLLLKDLRSYWRTPEYNATRLTISLGVALIFGSMYWMRAHRRYPHPITHTHKCSAREAQIASCYITARRPGA